MRRMLVLSFFLLAVLHCVCPAPGVSGETETHTLPETRVIEARIEAEAERVSLEALQSGRFSNLGEAVTEIPGVSGVKRSHSAVEPVVRGLGWERVQTQVDGLPLYGACPGRMDPPAMILQPETVQEAYVVKGIPSVSLGPAGTGGRVMVSTDYERSEGAPPEFGGWLRSTYNGAREVLRRMLGREGWAVTEAPNGRIALQCVAREAPQLILLDLLMPEMDGFEFVAELRRRAEWRKLPVLVVTAKDLSDEDHRRLNGDVERVIRKSGQPRDELLNEVGAALAAFLARRTTTAPVAQGET